MTAFTNLSVSSKSSYSRLFTPTEGGPDAPLPPSACTPTSLASQRAPLSAGDVSTCYPKYLGTLWAHDAIADALEASAAGARNGASD